MINANYKDAHIIYIHIHICIYMCTYVKPVKQDIYVHTYIYIKSICIILYIKIPKKSIYIIYPCIARISSVC